MSKALIITCPNCKKEHNWQSSKPWSPFCSERCRLIDLGAWASEQHRIPGQEITQQELEQNSTNQNEV